MTARDLPAVNAIAAEVHLDFPEDAAIPAERLRLAAAGCFVIDDGSSIAGYVVSHPWRAFPPPKLNTLLGAIPTPTETWYVHDLALLPSARGHGHGGVIVRRITEIARAAGLPSLSLTAVSGSEPFWARHGFTAQHGADIAKALASYGPDATFMVRRLG